MHKKITVDEINNVTMVRTLMARLGMPNISDDALIVISKLEGPKFKAALARVNNDEDNEKIEDKYIKHVCSLITGASLSKLSALGHADIPLAALITIGKSCGMEFRDHMRKACDNDPISIHWIKRKLGKIEPVSLPIKESVEEVVNQSATEREVVDAAPEEYQNEDKKFISVHYFGGSAAMCFNASKKGEMNTIMLDSGDRFDINGSKKVDWKNAIHFQYTEQELVLMLAVLLGTQTIAEFKGHGAGNDKTFTIKAQKDEFYMSCSAKGLKMKGVPIKKLSAFSLTALVIRQLELNHPSLRNGGVVELTRNLSGDRIAA